MQTGDGLHEEVMREAETVKTSTVVWLYALCPEQTRLGSCEVGVTEPVGTLNADRCFSLFVPEPHPWYVSTALSSSYRQACSRT